jgi:hypothetical protein
VWRRGWWALCPALAALTLSPTADGPYTYVADVNPGMASGEGINLNGGPWYLMRADGDPLVPAGQPKLLGAPGLAS